MTIKRLVALATLAVVACAGSVGASPPTVSEQGLDNTSPSDVYRMYQDRQRQRKAELAQAAEALRPLAAGAREEELARARDGILESMDPGALAPFITRAQARKWQSIPADKRNQWFARYLSEESFPARLEVRREAIEGDQATLDVRGFFDKVDHGGPGWSTGTITLAREGGRWKVADETWDFASAETDGSPAPGDAAATCGRFKVSGDVDRVVDAAAVSEPRLATHGGWDFSLHDDGHVVMLRNIPGELAVGDYPFAADMPSIPHDWDWETSLDFPLHVVFAERSDTGGLGRTWDDDMTGVLTVESMEGTRVSGQFEFTDGSIQVLGSFCNVEVPTSSDAG